MINTAEIVVLLWGGRFSPELSMGKMWLSGHMSTQTDPVSSQSTAADVTGTWIMFGSVTSGTINERN